MDLKKKNIIISLMVAMFLGAVEGTVVTTAMPTIVKDLHGFGEISLIFSVYLLTTAISTPIYGKLSDLYGRKNTLSIGIIIFMLGSALCGLSTNMTILIMFRALQGIGAGAIFTVTYTIIGDVFPIEERAKIQGWISSVWGIASLLGPFLGGFLIDTLSWHWIFYINIPFGVLSVVLLQRNMEENIKKQKNPVDFPGILILSASIIVFLYSILSIKGYNDIFSIGFLIYLIFTAALLILFYFIENKTSEPLIPFEIFNIKVTIVNIIGFLVSAILVGTDVYLPIYLQNILGFSATISGLSLASMSISWLMSSFILSKPLKKYGEKAVILFSSLLILLSTILMYTLTAKSSLVLMIIYAFIIGFGYGGALTTMTIVIQESVEKDNRGIAIASNSLIKTIAQTIGVSIFGVVFNLNITKYLNRLEITNINPNNLYNSDNTKLTISSTNISYSLNYAFHAIILIFIVLSALCCISSLVLSNSLKERK